MPAPAPFLVKALLPFAASLAICATALSAPAPSELTTTSTISTLIQETTRQALTRRVKETNARSGAAIVLDVATGDILALASISTDTTAPVREHALMDAYEPGSVLQTFSIASAFAEGLASPDMVIDCGNGRYETKGRVIVDVHPLGKATVHEIFAQSNSIGAVKLTEKLSAATLRARLAAFGFGMPTGINLPREAAGVLRPASRWSSVSISSIARGYEMSATAVQLAAAMAALGNDGLYMEPRLVRPVGEIAPPEPLRRVVSPETSARMLELLRGAVEAGTGKTATPNGWSAAGKTGTTRKLDPVLKKYSTKSFISSFCGLAPAGKPRIAICVWVDDPRSGNYFSDTVAAPLFREIAETALAELRVPREREQ